MKIKNAIITAILLVAFLPVSCAPAVQQVPVGTAVPSDTTTPIPPTATLTSTPAPENLADAKDLPRWVDDYVHAFGGKVTVNGVVMDRIQLADAVRMNAEAFTRVKEVDGMHALFFVVNDVPLAVRSGNQWEYIPIRWLADQLEIKIGTNLSNPIYDEATRLLTDQLAIREFNHAISSSVLWWVIEQEEGKFDFSEPDHVVKLALTNRMSIEGDDLVTPWSYKYVPYLQEYIDKVKKGEIPREQVRDEAIELMREHIVGVMTRYKGSVTQWVVALEQRGPAEGDMFTDLIGKDYVDVAFEIARETDPQATLYYNDAYNETRDGLNYPDTLDIVRRLKEKKLIDAVGVEMHLDGANPPDKSEVIATLKSYELPVIVSSVDINMRDVKGTPEERGQIQAEILRNMFEAAMESGICRDFYFWEGLGDRNNWLERMDMPGVSSPDADPTIFDDTLRPKPSYFALKRVLYRMFMEQ